jgi:hypothetical protein
MGRELCRDQLGRRQRVTAFKRCGWLGSAGGVATLIAASVDSPAWRRSSWGDWRAAEKITPVREASTSRCAQFVGRLEKKSTGV